MATGTDAAQRPGAADAASTPGPPREGPSALAQARAALDLSLNGRGEFTDLAEARRLLDELMGDIALLGERRGTIGFSKDTDAPIRLRLIELLRSELIRTWTEPPSPPAAEMLHMLRILEELRTAAEPGGSHRVALELGDPATLGLVVEMAHDLRSPLTSILFLSEVLQNGRSGEINDLQRRQLEVIYSAAFALTTVADDLVDMSRRGERLGQEEPTIFSLAELVEGVAHMLRPMAEAKGIELRLSTPRDDRRLGRPAALNRVLMNLATNALKFTEEGFVEVEAETEGFDAIRFTVSDTGRGIPREARATLFETFRKSRQRKGFFFSGSGLGLSIARRLVEEMGGRLDYETRLDHGTRFFFTVKMPPPHL